MNSIEDINLACELRPIFEDYAYPPSVKPDPSRYAKLIGVVPVVVLEVQTADQKRFSVQLSEDEFANLREAMNRVATQVSVMKDRVQLVPPEAGRELH